MSSKLSCLEEILDKILIIEKKQNYKFDELQEISCLIPESLVAQVIGTAGKQIEQFNFNSGSKIIIDKGSLNAEKRIVRIAGQFKQFYQNLNQGTTKQILKAFEQIYQFIDHTIFKMQQNKQQFTPQKQPINKSYIVSKIVVEKSAIQTLVGENGYKKHEMEKKYSVQIMFNQEKDCCYLYPNEFVCKISGDLDQVSLACLEIIEKQSVIKNLEDADEPTLKILVLNKFIPKLLGKSGNQIKEIAYQANGPKIKIDERRPQKEYKSIEIPIIIKGQLTAQQDAVCIILHYIKFFKTALTLEEAPQFIQKTWRLQSTSRQLSRKNSRSSSSSNSSSSKSRSRSRSSKNSRTKSSGSSCSQSRSSSSSSYSNSNSKSSYTSKSLSNINENKQKNPILKANNSLTTNSLAKVFDMNEFTNNKLNNVNQTQNIEIQLPNQQNLSVEKPNQQIPFNQNQQQQLYEEKKIQMISEKEKEENTQRVNLPLNNSVQQRVVQTTLSISKDFAFKNYKKLENNFIQFSTLIPVEYYSQFCVLIEKYQEEIYTKYGAKLIADNEQTLLFSNDEQECFLLKVLGEQGLCVDAQSFIMNEFTKQL